MKNNYLMTVILVIIFAAAGFYGGTMYQKNQASSSINSFGSGSGSLRGASGFAGRRAGGGGGQVMGTVLTQDASSITVKLTDGSSKIVLLSNTTSFNQSAPASASDLKVGDRVAVFGATNSDGSVNATNVQLNPILRGNGGGPNPSGMPTPTQ